MNKDQYAAFVDLCCDVYNILRENAVLLVVSALAGLGGGGGLLLLLLLHCLRRFQPSMSRLDRTHTSFVGCDGLVDA